MKSSLTGCTLTFYMQMTWPAAEIQPAICCQRRLYRGGGNANCIQYNKNGVSSSLHTGINMPTYTFALYRIQSRTAGERMFSDYSIIFSHRFLDWFLRKGECSLHSSISENTAESAENCSCRLWINTACLYPLYWQNVLLPLTFGWIKWHL